MKKILFLTHGPIEAASSRVRVYQFLPYLDERGIAYEILPALPSDVFQKYYPCSRLFSKLAFWGMLFVRRLKHLLLLKRYDVIFLQREVMPYLPPFFEKIIRRKASRLIFDFDDAIYLSRKTGFWARLQRQKIEKIVCWSDQIIVGNEYLASFAKSLNSHVKVIPSCVDTERYVPLAQKNSLPIVVWVGTPSSLPYLKMMQGILRRFSSQENFVMRVVGADPRDSLGIPVQFLPWDLQREGGDLRTADIGIMPLANGERECGKCGYKLLQYMACGLPVIASDVGVNSEIVLEGVTGFLVCSEAEWEEKLKLLLRDEKLREKMGAEGRKRAESLYSLKRFSQEWVSMVEEESS
ncbi:MAG: glycosyltransferase family 4 protein [Chlamydiae bacterium]|nr:glycosyltransferase family 4 protein [Chlamydiota bacterium]MBI3267255.1 glycosyltransferase family 4 protein [Chlamydiota bacterium]